MSDILLLAAAVVATAVLSSVLTLILARRQFAKTIGPLLEQRLRSELEVALEGLGDIVEERVKRGVLEAISSLPAGDLLRDGPAGVVKTASRLVEGGLSSLLGGGRAKEEED